MTNAVDRPRLGRGKKLAFACVPLIMVLALVEIAVRMTGVAETCPNVYQNTSLWACDPVLGSKLNPQLAPMGQPLNKAGFRTHEFTAKAPGVYRIISLGDSCTFGVLSIRYFGYVPEPYPQRLERLVDERIGPGKVEVLNTGVPGYNSFHGVMLLRTKLRGLSPDLITVRFGWNDHLISPRSDERTFMEPDNPVVLAAQDLLLRTALYPFTRRLEMELQRLRVGDQKVTAAQIPAEWKPNVPVALYKHNLRRMAELGRAQGAEVWFLTSPHAFVTEENRGRYEEASKVTLVVNAIPTYERLIEIHDSYNAATRETGAELGVPVIDMDAAYRQHASEHLFDLADVPHPTQEGHNLEAEMLYQRLLAEGKTSD